MGSRANDGQEGHTKRPGVSVLGDSVYGFHLETGGVEDTPPAALLCEGDG